MGIHRRVCQQLKWAAKAKPQQLELGKGIFQGTGVQLWQLVAGMLGGEEAGVFPYRSPGE